MIPRFFKPPAQASFFLFGPRGTGKTTWIKSNLPDAMVIDLLEPEQMRLFSARPEFLRERLLGAGPSRRLVVIDEIQKVPELLSLIHALIEQDQGWRFVLTGSSARKLKRTGVNLLAGRVLLTTMHPFMAAELGDGFTLDKALKYGLLPVVVSSQTPDLVLSTYVALYVREEVQLEGLVRNIGSFNRFLEAISFSHAQLLNVSQVARECQVERKVVTNYIDILEDLLLAVKLPVFTRRAKRKTVAHAKLYLFDAGVFRGLRPRGPLDRPEEIDGAALEGLVMQHLMAYLGYRSTRTGLYYWRTHHGSEVDFVVYGDDGFFAFEVKNAQTLRPADLRGITAFMKDYPEATPCILYRGSQRFRRNGILCLPLEQFLIDLHPQKSLDHALNH